MTKDTKPRRHKPYTQKQKVAALTILDFFDGNYSRASLVTGVNRHVLAGWKDDLAVDVGEVRQVYTEGLGDILACFKRLIQSLSAVVLIKAQDASVRDLYYLIGIVSDKIENLEKLVMVQHVQAGLALPPEINEPKELPPSIDAELQRAKWEAVVEEVIATAERENCEIVTRETAVAAIIRENPEAKPYLM